MLNLLLASALALQPAPSRAPYLDVVARYGPGTASDAISLLAALRLRDVDRVFDALDGACAADGARSCQPRDLAGASPEVAQRVAARWRQLYPRVMALHAEALVVAGSVRDAAGVGFHSGVLRRLTARCAEIARRPDAPPAVAGLAVTGPRLLVWAFQYLRDDPGLDRATQAMASSSPDDVELWLARGALAELRTRRDAIAAAELETARALERRGGAVDQRPSAREQAPTDVRLEGEIARRVEGAASVYERALKVHPASAELHLRLGRLLTLIDRTDDAERHLTQVDALQADPRQTYLTALFLGDLREAQQRPADALAAYAAAQRAWPGAQAPVVAMARLQVLTGSVAAARATLAAVYAERDMRERSDPWLGYVGGQGWRMSGALAALQRSFEVMP
jgi:tetratricopeptide (TPR) repeat protein